MKIAFMTLGCPAWDLQTVIYRAREYGYDGVDFRGLAGALDITRLNEFRGGLAETARRIAGAGLEVSAVSSSLLICDRGKMAANLEEARRTIPVALGLGCRRVRVFGGGDVSGPKRAEAVAVGKECMARILEMDGAREIEWMLETHDSWIRPKDCRCLLDAVGDPAFVALWDMGHTFRVEKVSAEESCAVLGDRLRYVHVKDAVWAPEDPKAGSDGWRFVPPGQGELRLAESIGVLRGTGYDGWLVFEHEKRWHPDLEEPESIFPAFVEWVRPLIGRA